MSRAKAKADRAPQDSYETPPSAILPLFEHPEGIDPKKYRNILEPCAGSGNILRALRQAGATGRLQAVELYERREAVTSGEFSLMDIADYIYWDDFRTLYPEWNIGTSFDLIITNPPYSIAQAIIDRAFNIAQPDTVIAMLLRINFLASQNRREWWESPRRAPSRLGILTKRPSFTGGKTDATEYAWYIWDKNGLPGMTKIFWL